MNGFKDTLKRDAQHSLSFLEALTQGRKLATWAVCANRNFTSYLHELSRIRSQTHSHPRFLSFRYIRASTVVQPHALVLFAAEMAVAPLEPVFQEYVEVDLDDEDAGPVPKPEPGSALFSEPEKPVAVVLDRWLRFQMTAVEAAQLYCLRERLAATFAFKVRLKRRFTRRFTRGVQRGLQGG